VSTQDVEFMPQHQQLDVFRVQTAAAPNERTQKRPKREVEEGEAMPPILPGLAPRSSDTILAPFRGQVLRMSKSPTPQGLRDRKT